MAGAVAPIEEQEVLVDQAPLLENDAGTGTVSGPYRRLAKKAAAAAALGALMGSALVAMHKASPGSLWAKANTPSALWDSQWHEGGSQWHEQGNLGNQGGSQWHEQGNLGNQGHTQQDHQWHHQDEDGDKVNCAGEHCTCEWSSAKQCSRKDSPQTKCWGCCCRAKFPDSYRYAMNHQDHGGWQPGQGQQQWPSYEQRPSYGHHVHGQSPGHDEEGQFQRGDDVNVQSGHGNWHPATVLNRVSQGRYQVQYDMSRRVEVVTADTMVDGVWTPWWVWVGWVLLVAACMLCVVGLIGFFLRGKKRGGGDDDAIEDEPILRDSSQDRTCGRTCS